MSIVNFTIPETLEKKVEELIKKKGFSSKAEFFRFAAINFIDIMDKPLVSEEDRFEYLVNTLHKEIKVRYGNKKIPSVRKQLADL